ncbi:MAG: electron transporter SenC [Acidocella sp. 20-57-95]|nr:MAG: electron transporter SenC [Acidocella sp. 20-57-95]OYV62587.1 MAG: electron transporter SenC [Acidocella sp. 21-58-7]HQT64183.1 SCO family protein [Acidocella sp.]HQU02693.1 SCO family protein [Acetobacteraceae bacterium]HQU04153.1 SCO family protein [Acidocella sp.]
MIVLPRHGRQRGHQRLSLLAAAALFLLTACHKDLSEQDVSIQGLVPPLAISMQDVTTDKPVTAADFQGKVTLLYFGYTNCPDVCPFTLANIDRILHQIGPQASKVTVLFVTVDPDRDTPASLAQYTALFGPNVQGLRGTPDELYSLARRYRVVFSVTKATANTAYQVTHSAAVYVFNAKGKAQFIISGLDTNKPDLTGIAADLSDVISQGSTPAWLAWLERLTSG